MTDTPTPPPTSPTPASPTPDPKENTKAPKIGLIITAVLVLLAAGAYWAFLSTPTPKPPAALTLATARQQSDSLYNELKHQLALYKQENEDLYTQIAEKEAQLQTQYTKIQRLINQAERDRDANKTIQNKLRSLAAELDKLETYVEKQTLDLDELRAENRRLRAEKQRLDEAYARELEARKRLEEQGASLQEANAQMAKRLQAAAVLQTTNVQASGWRIKNNGERRGVNVAKRTEAVSVCFDLVPNEVIEQGPNRFYLRMVAPDGRVVQDPNRGSGRLELWEKSGIIAYTTSKIFEYNPTVKNLCIDWSAYPDTPFQAGTYRMELYNKGRLVGTYNFNTK